MFIEHAAQAHGLGAELYLVSVAKTAKGIREGNEHYPEVARTLGIPVLLANCVGPADNFIGAGGSQPGTARATCWRRWMTRLKA
jgi:hypothetical protein